MLHWGLPMRWMSHYLARGREWHAQGRSGWVCARRDRCPPGCLGLGHADGAFATAASIISRVHASRLPRQRPLTSSCPIHHWRRSATTVRGSSSFGHTATTVSGTSGGSSSSTSPRRGWTLGSLNSPSVTSRTTSSRHVVLTATPLPADKPPGRPASAHQPTTPCRAGKFDMHPVAPTTQDEPQFRRRFRRYLTLCNPRIVQEHRTVSGM